MIEYTEQISRDGWTTGPWDHEPQDKIQWTDTATGLPCLMRRSSMGFWCGYVGVEPGHPYHGKGYNEVDVRVHGGLTFADGCDHGPVEYSICHSPEPGKSDDIWWLGFDCGHLYDVIPERSSLWELMSISDVFLQDRDYDTAYRDIAYVRSECESLAKQLKDVA